MSNCIKHSGTMRCVCENIGVCGAPGEPGRRGCGGLKFHCLADHGYIWDFYPTSNQAGPDSAPPFQGLTPTGSMIPSASKDQGTGWSASITLTPRSLCCAVISRVVAVEQPDPPRLSFPLILRLQSLILESMDLRLRWLKIAYFKRG